MPLSQLLTPVGGHPAYPWAWLPLHQDQPRHRDQRNPVGMLFCTATVSLSM